LHREEEEFEDELEKFLRGLSVDDVTYLVEQLDTAQGPVVFQYDVRLTRSILLFIIIQQCLTAICLQKEAPVRLLSSVTGCRRKCNVWEDTK